MKYNVLVLGNGGREHALCWKLSQSSLLNQLYCIPGNAGIEEIAQVYEKPDLLDFAQIEEFCKEHEIHLIVVGKEDPLVHGIKDHFQDSNILVFGPTRRAAKLEGSKIYTKNLLAKYNIPTASYSTFFNKEDALFYLQSITEYPVVIKADGLAQGKGVFIASSEEEAVSSILDMMEYKKFQEAGERIIIEEYLEGREFSYQILVHNDQYYEFLPAQDYKKAQDGNIGPNTGGMGNISPVPWVTSSIMETIRADIVDPLIHALISEHNLYTGVMFLGIMIDAYGQPKVLEINVRFGDPETQVVLPLLQSDILEIMLNVAQDNQPFPHDFHLEWKTNSVASCVVLTSAGYPIAYEKNKIIHGLERIKKDNPYQICFHAGTKKEGGEIVTNGGRVLNLVGIGTHCFESTKKAYGLVDLIDFEGKTFRTDIGKCLE